MQTPKARTCPSEVSQKTSPAAPRTAHHVKTPGSDPDSVSSNPTSRTPKERSPKVIERRSPRSLAPEKKRLSRMSELESQVAQLQEDLKKTKEQLSSSDSAKQQAEEEAEETKKHLLMVSAKLKDSQQQLLDLSASEEERLQELCKISHDRDLAWQSELEAVQKQHLMDTAALLSALNETQKLKAQLEMVAGSEAAQAEQAESACAEADKFRQELVDSLALIDNLKEELSACKESEARFREVIDKTRGQLETIKRNEEALRSEGFNAMKAYDSVVTELEQSKTRVESLEQLLKKNEENEDIVMLKAELDSVKNESSQLRSAVEASEIRYQEEYIKSTLQIRCAYEQVERAKSESCLREVEWKAEDNRAKAVIEELKAKLMDKETELQGISEENEGLSLKIERIISNEGESQLKKVEADLADMKMKVMDKEMKLQITVEENEMLKLEALKGESAGGEGSDKHSRRAARAIELLDATQAMNSQLEAELRRMKVQSDQWRKAAEAAATMLSPSRNGKLIERRGSLDSNSLHAVDQKIGSPRSDDSDDELIKKKNGNMLKKFGVLWKKGQK